MPFSDIFVEALTKVSASRKAYLRHLYIKPACYEENALVSASEVFASKSDDSRKIIPGSLRSFSVFQFRRSKYRKQRHPNDPLFG